MSLTKKEVILTFSIGGSLLLGLIIFLAIYFLGSSSESETLPEQKNEPSDSVAPRVSKNHDETKPLEKNEKPARNIRSCLEAKKTLESALEKKSDLETLNKLFSQV